LVEALVAMLLLTLTLLAVLRIQAVWAVAEDDARLQRLSARWMQTTIDRWIGGAAPAAALAVEAVPQAGAEGPLDRLSLQHVPRLADSGNETTSLWVLTQASRTGPVTRWQVQAHRFVVDLAVYAGWAADEALHQPGWWAPGGRPGGLDPGFGRGGAHAPDAGQPGNLGGWVPLRSALDTSVVADRQRRSVESACAGADLDAVLLGRASTAACDPTQYATRAGAIRWAAEIDSQPALAALRGGWLAAVLQAPTLRGDRALGDPRCGYQLAAPGSQDLVWRCLGAAWSEPPPAPTPAAPVEPPRAADADDDFAFAGRPIHPLAGLPPGLRACRYTTGGPSHPRPGGDAVAAGAAILQHQRVYWWVGPASHACPADTQAEQASGLPA
jgi:Tfp pilus assembly protein PilV